MPIFKDGNKEVTTKIHLGGPKKVASTFPKEDSIPHQKNLTP